MLNYYVCGAILDVKDADATPVLEETQKVEEVTLRNSSRIRGADYRRGLPVLDLQSASQGLVLGSFLGNGCAIMASCNILDMHTVMALFIVIL